MCDTIVGQAQLLAAHASFLLQENVYCDNVDEVYGLTCCQGEAIGDHLEVRFCNTSPSGLAAADCC